MDWTLEVVVVPVCDVERSIRFYRDQLGFTLDHDTAAGEMRFVQLTPPGSGCSIVIGSDIPQAEPGSYRGLQLVVADIATAHAQLVERGVDVSEVQQIDPRDGGTLCNFADPDGNTWVVQEIKARAQS
jgi:catechol 2,3-dioxygenase-like lactoylglutathione lyase family enzyme